MHFSLKVLRDKKFLFLLFAFCILHILLINVNVAEWGDSYRILRASEFIRDLSYPLDEKRPPLFSIFLAMRPGAVDAVLWAKWFMLFISISYFVLFFLFLNLFEEFQKNKYVYLALLFLMLNPVFLYWSIRIMADVLFAFLVLGCLFFLTLWRKTLSAIKCCFLAFLSALAIFTRFEGYILFVSIAFGLLFLDELPALKSECKEIFLLAKKQSRYFFTYIAFVVLYVFPYLLFKNPLKSSYFEEPEGRAYDLKMIWVYVASFLFLFGFVHAIFFLITSLRARKNLFVKNPAISFFIFAELALILLWPAAIPRLFVSIIPLLILPMVMGIGEFFERGREKVSLVSGVILIAIYVIFQFFLRLQFLVLYKSVFVSIILTQFLIAYTLFRKKYFLFVFSVGISMFIWSISTIYLHKDIYQSIKSASQFVSQLNCNLVHNDTTSIAEWYLFDNSEYLELENDNLWNCDSFLNKGFSCMIFTNEHNAALNFDSTAHYCLKQINEFRYKIDERDFFSKVYLIKGDTI